MEEIFAFIEQHTGIIINWATLGAIGSALALYFAKRIVPAALSKLQTMIITIVANLFGTSLGGNADVVKPLPFLSSFDTFGKDLEINLELRLLDLKRQLVSPLYTEVQKAALKVMYDKLLLQIGPRLSEATKDALKAYEA